MSPLLPESPKDVTTLECRIEARGRTFAFAETFVISRSAEDHAETVQVKVSAGGMSGFGEAAPTPRYDESVGSALEFVRTHGKAIAQVVGADPLALETIDDAVRAAPGSMAAKAAIDAAVHDLAARLLGLPVHRLLGLSAGGPPTSWTIWMGDPDDMARRAERAYPGIGRLKLKLGGGDGLDLDRAAAVRAVTDGPLTADVNEWWSFDEAVEGCEVLARLGFEHVEQPLVAGHEQGAELKRRAPLPVFVDEDCHTLADLRRCSEIADGVNVKLVKSGGVREALRMVHAARALGLRTMLGCMGESGLGIAPAVAIAPLFDYVDLDGNLLLGTDPHLAVTLVDGVQIPAAGPGFGIEVPW